MRMLLMAALGGAIGAGGRYLVSFGVVKFIGYGFPWGTLIVNIIGSLAMGLLIESIALRWSVSNEVRTFLATGVLGGFTTFSAFSLDAVVMIERNEWVHAFAYISCSVVFSIAALFLGLYLARSLI